MLQIPRTNKIVAQVKFFSDSCCGLPQAILQIKTCDCLSVEMCVEIWQCCHTIMNTMHIYLSKDDGLISLLSSDAC